MAARGGSSGVAQRRWAIRRAGSDDPMRDFVAATEPSIVAHPNTAAATTVPALAMAAAAAAGAAEEAVAGAGSASGFSAVKKGDWANLQIGFVPDKDGGVPRVTYTLWTGVPVHDQRRNTTTQGYTHTVYGLKLKGGSETRRGSDDERTTGRTNMAMTGA